MTVKLLLLVLFCHGAELFKKEGDEEDRKVLKSGEALPVALFHGLDDNCP